MNYIKIDKEDVCNGNGLRVVLWLSGCNHHCNGCQNPQTWDENEGVKFGNNAKNEIFKELNKPYISGITLTGGDPLHEANIEDVLSLIIQIRSNYKRTKTIWIYTGYTWESIFNNSDSNSSLRKSIVQKCDVLVDGPYIDSLRDITLAFRGSSNQRLIDVQKTLKSGEVVL